MNWPLALLFGAAALFVGWLATQPLLRRRRLARIEAQPFPPDWDALLRRRCGWYPSAPSALVTRLQRAMQVFLADKRFVGCNGLAVTDEMRVIVAAQACLLVAARTTDPYPWVSAVLLYPATFLVDREHVDEAGVHRVEREALAGESWDEGRVILSWQDILEDAQCADGVNVVVHEFAHQLDRASGDVNGAPMLHGDSARWARVMSDEYEKLADAVERGNTCETVLDPYGATDPGEFFAVASEAFVETPRALAGEHPALYDLLRGYYRFDPASWRTYVAGRPGSTR